MHPTETYAMHPTEMEIETRNWCQMTWLIKPHRKTCILTHLDDDLSPLSDLRSNFEIDLVRPKSICSVSTRRGKHDDVVFIFVFIISKKELTRAPMGVGAKAPSVVFRR